MPVFIEENYCTFPCLLMRQKQLASHHQQCISWPCSSVCLSFRSSVPLSLLETGLAHLPSLGQPGLGQISGHRSPDLWSGHPCLGSYTHSQFNVLPTFPLKSRAHVCSWPCSQEMVIPSPGDTSYEPAGREGGPSAKQCAVLGSR